MRRKTFKVKSQQDASPRRQDSPPCCWGEILLMPPNINDDLLHRVWSRLSPGRFSDTQIAMLRESLQEMLGADRSTPKRVN
jgi:hypothetical protein